PLEGTRLTALGQQNAIAVIAVAERGTMFFPGAALYMDKIATGPEAADAIDITARPAENVRRVAEAKGKTPRDVTVIVLERDRHEELIAELRGAGARVTLIRDGDVAPASAAARSPVHARRRRDRLDRDALAVWHRAPRRGRARVREALRALRAGIPLTGDPLGPPLGIVRSAPATEDLWLCGHNYPRTRTA